MKNLILNLQRNFSKLLLTLIFLGSTTQAMGFEFNTPAPKPLNFNQNLNCYQIGSWDENSDSKVEAICKSLGVDEVDICYDAAFGDFDTDLRRETFDCSVYTPGFKMYENVLSSVLDAAL